MQMKPPYNGAGPSTSPHNVYPPSYMDEMASGPPRKRSSDAGDENTQRVQLACFYCRAKRIRCSGEKPICQACIKANVECEWPAGRRRKRTRREMEEAKRLEADRKAEEVPKESQPSSGPPTDSGQNLAMMPPTSVLNEPSLTEQWAIPATSNFVWPSNFLPDPSGNMFSSFDMGNASVTQAQTGLGGQIIDPALAGFMNSPPSDLRLLNALESQTAYLNGDPSEDKDLELYYYRFSGSTAIHPGINRISLKLQRRADYNQQPAAAPQPETGDEQQAPARAPDPVELFDSSGMPHAHIWRPLFDLFFKNMSQHFPSISRQRMHERFDSGTMSNFLANCMCAIGARFSDNDNPLQACAPFVAKAQELVIPLLHIPAYDVVTGLLLLAWASFGQNSESGLWQYSGMAFRMAIDLGVHENSEIYESPAHVVRTRLLFWSLFVTDRIVAFATGRPASIPEDIVEVPLPEDADFFPDPARNTIGSLPEAIQPVPYVQLVKLMIICGRISNVLNGRRGRVRTLVSTEEPLTEHLAELQSRLVQFYSSLPESMRWSVDNFKYQESRGHGGTFLTLHLWANAVLALIYHPDLLKSPSGIETPLNRSISRSVKLALASSRQICECMVFADLVSHTSYTATPFVVQPLYVAAMALIHEMRSTQPTEATGTASDLFLVSMARQNFSALLKAVLRMELYWAGVNYVATLLEKRSGFSRSSSKALKRTFISLPDNGLLKRFSSDRDHPHNVAPATETSLRESIARSHSNGPSPFWVSDLLSGYSVENMSFTPVDSLDLARLMALGAVPTPEGASSGRE